jgi:FixJ family two-component response regulator
MTLVGDKNADRGVIAASRRARVALVLDDDRARDALGFSLLTAGLNVASYATAYELLEEISSVNFDCIVSDIFLPRMNGLELQERLREAEKFVSIVFVTGRGDLSIGVRAMRAGAVDVLEKPFEEQALLSAIKRGVQRSRRRRTEYTERRDLERRLRSLPARQRELFVLITAGLLNKQAAAKMGISERTVKVHRVRLRNKMGTDSLAELSRMAAVLRIHTPRGDA